MQWSRIDPNPVGLAWELVRVFRSVIRVAKRLGKSYTANCTIESVFLDHCRSVDVPAGRESRKGSLVPALGLSDQPTSSCPEREKHFSKFVFGWKSA